jgi:hypothetical protein
MSADNWDISKHGLICDVLACQTILVREVNKLDQGQIICGTLCFESTFNIPTSVSDFFEVILN